MSPNPAGKKWVTAQSKTSFVSGGSVRNAVWVSSQCDPTMAVICMRGSLSENAEWSEWDERHGRHSREDSGRALREQPRYNTEKLRKKGHRFCSRCAHGFNAFTEQGSAGSCKRSCAQGVGLRHGKLYPGAL